MPRARYVLVFGLVMASLAGCGGAQGAETVVRTETVERTVPGPPPDATSPPGSAGAASPPTETVSSLPEDGIAVQGRFAMRIMSVDSSFGDIGELSLDEGEERAWFATMSCEARCSVELRRELGSGGFETKTLERIEGDPQRFGKTERTDTAYCYRNPEGRTTKRLSLRATGVEQRSGQPTATRLDGYVTESQSCGAIGVRKGTITLRGSLDDRG